MYRETNIGDIAYSMCDGKRYQVTAMYENKEGVTFVTLFDQEDNKVNTIPIDTYYEQYEIETTSDEDDKDRLPLPSIENVNILGYDNGSVLSNTDEGCAIKIEPVDMKDMCEPTYVYYEEIVKNAIDDYFEQWFNIDDFESRGSVDGMMYFNKEMLKMEINKFIHNRFFFYCEEKLNNM